jgi:hypothetical protein
MHSTLFSQPGRCHFIFDDCWMPPSSRSPTKGAGGGGAGTQSRSQRAVNAGQWTVDSGQWTRQWTPLWASAQNCWSLPFRFLLEDGRVGLILRCEGYLGDGGGVPPSGSAVPPLHPWSGPWSRASNHTESAASGVWVGCTTPRWTEKPAVAGGRRRFFCSALLSPMQQQRQRDCTSALLTVGPRIENENADAVIGGRRMEI